MSAFCQRTVYAHSLELIVAEDPENHRSDKDQEQIYDFSDRYTQDISHKQAGIFAEISSPGQNRQTNSDTAGGKYRNDRISRSLDAAAYFIQEQREDHRKDHHGQVGILYAAHYADGHACQRGVSEGV